MRAATIGRAPSAEQRVSTRAARGRRLHRRRRRSPRSASRRRPAPCGSALSPSSNRTRCDRHAERIGRDLRHDGVGAGADVLRAATARPRVPSARSAHARRRRPSGSSDRSRVAMPQPTSSRPSRIERGSRSRRAQPNALGALLRSTARSDLLDERLVLVLDRSRRSCAGAARPDRSSARRPARPSPIRARTCRSPRPARAYRSACRMLSAHQPMRRPRRWGRRTASRVASADGLGELAERGATSARARRGAARASAPVGVGAERAAAGSVRGR